jgi:hypothetical protein
MPTLAEQLGITEDTPKYPNDGVTRRVYLNCLACVLEKGTKKTFIEEEPFEVIIMPEREELDDGFAIESHALWRAKHIYLNQGQIYSRMREKGVEHLDWYVDMVILWQFPIPINKLKLHNLG